MVKKSLNICFFAVLRNIWVCCAMSMCIAQCQSVRCNSQVTPINPRFYLVPSLGTENCAEDGEKEEEQDSVQTLKGPPPGGA